MTHRLSFLCVCVCVCVCVWVCVWVDRYQTSFRVILSHQNPHTFVLQVHQGLSLPFAVQHIMERDLLALTARSFWALALKNTLSGQHT